MGLISHFDRAETWPWPKLIVLTCATTIIIEKKNMGKFFDMELSRIL